MNLTHSIQRKLPITGFYPFAIPERRNVRPYMLTLQNQYLNENILQGGAGKSGKCTFCVKYLVSYGFIHADPQGMRVLLY